MVSHLRVLLKLFMCISYEYSIWGVSYIYINMGLRSYGFTRCVSFNVPDPGTIWDGTVHALRLHCVPPCLLFILDRQRKLNVFYEYIIPYTPLFRCTVHNFGRLTCVSLNGIVRNVNTWRHRDVITIQCNSSCLLRILCKILRLSIGSLW